MSENSFKSIRNGAVASILATGILALIPEARNYGFAIFEWCWKAATDTYSLPGWAWIPIILLALFGVISIYFGLRHSRKKPEFTSYREDFLFSAKWRWSWDKNQIKNLWCFCPSCDATLVYDDSSCDMLYRDNETYFLCENCNNRIVSTFKGDHNYALAATEREIVRRIRTGEYKAR